ncbi:hypothetical protein BEL04_05850 [Mucilaginibacter sp. PPCGB 2223]|uniref:hypothetical protein n=1 Tax=Mucilaginibacter sp. PPCGB 2223 TaxID=1886027 RepID=UPI000824D813|nr:hypothetical protein [Mucilaginibacter sp. PPCGB 2223]OCX53808.1 hypothetical protein BEL04_05850 [Mucilaginibacter sp. PPCGB 2223]
MVEQNQILEIPGLFGNKIRRRIIFETEGITIEKPFSFDSSIFIPAANIAAIRLGAKWIRGLWFAVGKRFIIELKLNDNTVSRLNLTSYYNLKAQTYEEAWTDTISHLYTFYFSGQFNMYLELLHMRQPFEMLGVTFHEDGISWGKNGTIPWRQIALSNYRTYFVVHHKQNVRLNKSFNFLNDWNAYILQAIMKYVIEEHKKMLSR